MRLPNALKRLASVALVVLLCFQVVVLAHHMKARSIAELPLVTSGALYIGQELDSLVLRTENDTPAVITMRHSLPTIVLAFRSTCAFCDEVADEWRDWLSRDHRARVLLLSDEPPDSAAAYRASHSWRASTLSSQRNALGSAERALSGRTPWIYVFDSTGVISAMFHGADISAIDTILNNTGAIAP